LTRILRGVLFDCENAIVTVVRELPAERKVQLYNFARFLLEKSRPADQPVMVEDMDGDISNEDLVAEDALWEAAMIRHADQFAALKPQAKAEVRAGKILPMFDDRGELGAWSFDANG
jgi:hypothetical protein